MDDAVFDAIVRIKRKWSAKELLRLIEQAVEHQVETYVRRYVGSTIAGLEGRVSSLTEEMTILGERMTSVEQERWDQVGVLWGLIKAEFASVKTQLEAAIADKEAAVAAGVESALGEEAAADIVRLDALITEFGTVLPTPNPVPEVPEPAPGEPAVDPGSGQTSDDVLAGGSGDGTESQTFTNQ